MHPVRSADATMAHQDLGPFRRPASAPVARLARIATILALMAGTSLTGWMALGTHLRAGGADQVGPIELTLVSASPGGTAGLTLSMVDGSDVAGLDLRLDLGAGGKLHARAADVSLNSGILPSHRLGEHLLNQAQDIGPGRIRMVMLDPGSIPSGQVPLVNLRLAISSSTFVGERLPVRLAGRILRRGHPDEELPPIAADLVVVAGSRPTLTPFPSPTPQPSASITSTPTPDGGTAHPFTVRGRVILERRDKSAGASVCVGGRCVTTDADGRFSLTEVRVGDLLEARHPSYLRAARHIESAPSPPGTVTTLPDVIMLGGDVDQDGRIYDTDAGRIAGSWGQTPGGPRWSEVLDVNADGRIGGPDMVAVQYNFRRDAPGPWSAE